MRRKQHYEGDDATFNADAYTVDGYRGIAWHVLGWETLTCQRCGYRWLPRKLDVRQCPRCRSVRWDEPRGEEKA